MFAAVATACFTQADINKSFWDGACDAACHREKYDGGRVVFSKKEKVWKCRCVDDFDLEQLTGKKISLGGGVKGDSLSKVEATPRPFLPLIRYGVSRVSDDEEE